MANLREILLDGLQVGIRLARDGKVTIHGVRLVFEQRLHKFMPEVRSLLLELAQRLVRTLLDRNALVVERFLEFAKEQGKFAEVIRCAHLREIVGGDDNARNDPRFGSVELVAGYVIPRAGAIDRRTDVVHFVGRHGVLRKVGSGKLTAPPLVDQRIFCAGSGGIVAMLEEAGVVQQHRHQTELRITPMERRFGSGLLPAPDYAEQAGCGLQRMLEIMVAHVDAEIAGILAGKHARHLAENLFHQRPALLPTQVSKDLLRIGANCGRVFGVYLERAGHGRFLNRVCRMGGQVHCHLITSMGHRRNLIIGLTGGMGCGKSTAAGLFAEHGFVRLDADQVVRDELLTDAEVITALKAKYGMEIVGADGKVNRAGLASIVFTDEAQLRWLEALLHPRLYARWRALFAVSDGQKFIVEVPLLFEQGMENWFDFTVCITSECATQIRRLESRGIPPKLARQRLAQQLPLARKCELADFVILNDGSLEFLREQIHLLAQRFLQHQPASPAPL